MSIVFGFPTGSRAVAGYQNDFSAIHLQSFPNPHLHFFGVFVGRPVSLCPYALCPVPCPQFVDVRPSHVHASTSHEVLKPHRVRPLS